VFSDSRKENEVRSPRAITPPSHLETLEQRLLLSLLGMQAELEFPDVYYDTTGRLTYTAPAGDVPGTFDSVALPTQFKLSASARPVAVKNPRDFHLAIRLNGDGSVAGGIAGADLQVDGWIDMNNNNVVDGPDYSGVLLTAEILQFGFNDSGGPNDNYDFRLYPTGGALMPFFAGKDVGLVMTSLNSTFAGIFTEGFTGWCQGIIGPVDALRGAMSGQAFQDSNDSGSLDPAESGIGGVAVALDGTNFLGQAVHAEAVTAADGTYGFANLLPGSYTIAETQPAGYLDAAGSVNAYAGVALGVGQSAGGMNFGEILPASVAGSAFVDANDDGVRQADEAGLAGVTVALTGTDDLGGAVSATTQTAADGSYAFASLRPGTYAVTESQPAGYLDAAGSPNERPGIVLAGGARVEGIQFGEILPAGVSGFVWVDFNNDGEIDFNERAIENVLVTLTGINDQGEAVQAEALTGIDGEYFFDNLRPGTYAVTESQPAGYPDGQVTIGTAGGVAGVNMAQGISLAQNVTALNYNFGELAPTDGRVICSGMTASIGFWNNKKGQALIKALNGSAQSTQLGNWLAATLPNMYADLAGKTNAQVAAYYQDLFKNGKRCGLLGPAKLDAQVMAVALATYVTNSSLAGTVAGSYGFRVTEDGVGVRTINVNLCGAAFGVANWSVQTVLQLLWATDARSTDGRLYDVDGDGRTDCGELVQRVMANVIYTLINELGEIG
jgi:protocatechuate 3,4-dioxygenase beta subunit